ncbi:hypothetical protein KFL_015470010, partial [Klebsormidium nitens]
GEHGDAATTWGGGCTAGGHRSGVVCVCESCSCPSLACLHTEAARIAVVMPMSAEGVQVETPKLVRPTDGSAVHDPPVTLLKQPVRVSQLTFHRRLRLIERTYKSSPSSFQTLTTPTRTLFFFIGDDVFFSSRPA